VVPGYPARKPACRLALLATHWVWSGLVYHLGYFREINRAALIFGALFILQGLLFAWFARGPRALCFVRSGSPVAAIGLFLVAYGLLYPVVGMAFGLAYPRMPTFGVPCPTAIMTAGFLLMATATLPRSLLIIPILWAVVGGSAAFVLGIHADLMLGVAGVALVLRLILPRRMAMPVAS
jgi:hypothetical protein